MNDLRAEILQAQKNRADLVKWKLILVSTLGSIGIGLTSASSVTNIQLVLCCIPFICMYVDMLAYHHALNTHVIGQFMRVHPTSDDYMKDYEEFAWQARHLKSGQREISAYDFESTVFVFSSVIFSFSTVVYGALNFGTLSIPIIASGSIGVISSIYIDRQYKIRKEKIRKMKPYSPSTGEGE